MQMSSTWLLSDRPPEQFSKEIYRYVERARFSLSSPEGGEGRGEEALCHKLKSPHPNPLPAWAERGRRKFSAFVVRFVFFCG
jgi:hypothetical protein